MKKQTYNFVLTVGIKEALEIAAQKDRRSMSGLVEKALIDYFEKENIPWANDQQKSIPIKTSRPKKSISKK